MKNPYQPVRDFETALCEFTGAPYAVAVNSCTSALMLAVAWHLQNTNACNEGERSWITLRRKWGADHVHWPAVEIPRRTYLSVPMSIIHAGGAPIFRDEDWKGAYQLKPLPVWDCARRFTSGMYRGAPMNSAMGRDHDQITDCSGQFLCVSFHASKILGDTQGGAILHDNPEADAWLRRARFNGRTEGVAPKDDTFTQIGWHFYMSPDVAARLLLKVYSLPQNNADLPNDDYPELDKMDIFK